MSGNAVKEKAGKLLVERGSRYELLQKLIVEGFFDKPVSSVAVVLRVKERFGKAWKTVIVQTYMQKFMQADIIRAIKPSGRRENYWVIASVAREEALRLLGKKKQIVELEERLFSDVLEKKMSKNFGSELEELHSNFDRNPNCTAFMLRKIIEKLIIIVMSKHGKATLLEDKNRPGGWVGLKAMIETAAREKLNGVPFLIPRTADEIKGIKFLGDTAAHNPLVSVDSRTIVPQMPFIITAYEELAKRL